MYTNSKKKRSLGGTKIANLFEDLRNGERKTIPNDKIFIVLGVTGTGKSTFVQYIAGDNAKLQSIELVEDSGEFIIVDANRISNSTTKSQTIIPELFYDPNTDTNFYDCPGFSDTRSTSMDITSIYLIKKLISRSKNIKMVFTVNYPSVQKGVDRSAFMEFVNHGITLIKDVNKYRNSMALIVTKVNNEYVKRGGKFRLVPDNTIIQKIGNFLLEVLDDQQKTYDNFGQSASPEEKKFYEQAINFISILASKKNNKYDRIDIFRRPDETGPLSEIPLLQDGKAEILNLLHNRLAYTEVDPNDFGYTISDKSKNDIYEIIEYFNNEIQNNVRLVINKISIVYDTKIEKYLDNFQTLNDNLDTHYTFIIKTVKAIDDKTTIEKYLLLLVKLLDDIDVELPENEFENIIDLNKYLNFLQMFRKNNLKKLTYGWKDTLNDIEKIIQKWKIWVSFLFKVNSFISEYKVQNNANLMNDISKAFINNSYKEFLHDSDVFDKQILDDLNRIKINDIMKAMLNQLIKARMQTKVDIRCLNSNEVRIHGEFVKLSELNFAQCWNKNVNHVEFFASDTIYIDTNFVETNKKMHILIFAPTWQIIGHRQIILDGSDGAMHNIMKAESGLYPSGNGHDGLPGKPGKAGGTFLGLGMKFIDGEHLQITANGGNGGPGQDGGDGADGQDGKRVTIPRPKVYQSCPTMHFSRDNNYYKMIERALLFSTLFDGYGTGATKGGNGGNGGIGGPGSESGTIKLIELRKKSKIKIEMNEGKRGQSGIGGEAGQGGYNSKTRLICSNFIIWQTTMAAWSEKEHNAHYEKQQNGSRGQTGINGIDPEHPETRTPIPDPTDPFKRYKEFVQTKLRCFNKDYLLIFLQKFQQNSYVQKFLPVTNLSSAYNGEETTKKPNSYYNRLRAELNLKTNEQQLRKKRTVQFENFVNKQAISSLKNSNLSLSSNRISSDNYNEQIRKSLPYNIKMHQPEINSTLLLADIIIRKITNRKYLQYEESSGIRTDVAQALAVNILNDYENILDETFSDENLIKYNPIEMQTKILHLIINNRYKEISTYLTQTIFSYFDKRSNFDKFSKKIDQALNKYCTELN